jgi:hypothetical protein
VTVRGLVAAPVLALLPACFHPTFDHPACPDHVCPAGWTCTEATGICDPVQPPGGPPGGPPDASIDASDPGGGPDASVCFGSGLVKVCLASAPSGPVTIDQSEPLDTSVDRNCPQIVAGGANAVSDMCVFAGTTVTVGNVVAIGSRPLVVIATGTLSVVGTLDVSSKTGNPRLGAGANPGTCITATGAGDDTGGGGGGAGGSFGTKGGAGGSGDLNNNGPPAGTAKGGTAGLAQPSPARLRGGCPGGTGGTGESPQRAAGGDGGGAIYLIAGTSITIDGNVYASGGGGDADSNASGIAQGGGGGGSGGLIGFDAPSIRVTGRVVANGGAGGGGGGTTAGGGRGGEGTTMSWSARATGGTAGPIATANDGSGAAGTAVNQTGNVDGSDGDGGGGGGGGGLGVILISGALSGGMTMSPTPTQR